MDEHVEMPTCNLVEMVHNKWLRQSRNMIICLYEEIVDDLIRAFMQIANCKLWLRGGSTGKGLDSMSLKVATWYGNPKLLVDAIKSYLGVEDLYTGDCALEGFEFFGSTKQKLNVPLGVDCDSHRLDKLNYLIPRPNTKAKKDMHRKVLDFYRAWCGTYHIGVGD